MEDKNLFFVLLVVIWAILMIGFFLPYLFSMKNNNLVLISLGLIVAHVAAVVFFVNKMFKKRRFTNESK